ncbi:MAG TPA: hypothetical protein VG367_17590 [Mucilaginibacter sp.]|jgi:hypothetical protein|nr:hypothetical protein [Mucilaginibacter sp.]
MSIAASLNLNKWKNWADWKLLLFLVFFLDVKMGVKVAAIIVAYLLAFDFRFGFSFKNSRLPLFYALAIAIAFFDWVIGRNFGFNYDVVLLTGIGFWLLCILAMHQVKLSVDNHDAETINRTIILFFALNAAVSFFNLAAIIFETGHFNPYTYQGQYQKYFIGTGDYIRGITFDMSTTNAILNAFGVIYFLSKRNAAMLLLCMAVMLLTGSNCVNLLILLILGAIFIFKSTREQKSLILICWMFMIIFMSQVSPQNYMYVHETIKNNFFPQPIHTVPPAKPLPYITMRPDNTLTPEGKRQKTAQWHLDSIYTAEHPRPAPHKEYPITLETGRIIVPGVDINSRPYQHIAETTAYQRQLLGFIGTHKTELPISRDTAVIGHTPGKIVEMRQTLGFFKQHPFKLLTGDGAGNFSSKLAFRATAIGYAGGYPQKLAYINPDFLSNHLDIYLNFFSKNKDNHSLINDPGSVYDQLLAEYGLIGLAGFAIWYLGYFIRHYKKLTYGIPLTILLLGVFFLAYWFEQLSILLFFELLMLLNIKENSKPKPPIYAKS